MKFKYPPWLSSFYILKTGLIKLNLNNRAVIKVILRVKSCMSETPTLHNIQMDFVQLDIGMHAIHSLQALLHAVGLVKIETFSSF